MCRNIFAISIIGFLLITGCKKKEEYQAQQNSNSQSISGLLTSNDTLLSYEDLGLKKLSDYGFFNQPLNKLIPANNQVVPYELNSPLFTDYASKKRFIWLPEGSQLSYVKDESVFNFPNGAVIIKNFYYKNEELKTEEDIIIETRLLIKDEKTKQWKTLPYIWNEEQTEAYLYILGKDIDLIIERNDADNKQIAFKYSVPNINMCKNCHVKDQTIVPLGPTPRQLNMKHVFQDSIVKNQLAYLKDNKMLKDLDNLDAVHKFPNYLDPNSGSLNERARAYLDVNCAHCHQDGGSAKTSGLHLVYSETDQYKLGINKPPVAAGKGSGNLSYDIVEGKPNESILLFRMKHLEPDIVMPEIGKNLVHTEGVKLIDAWIASLGN
ncbi:SO2930 family diheme c-type cytochrome [Mariniflexile gromovii]|uniref:Repeat protein (TIGR03806 family) n=1 Tax=Mariniflexile gromovii TaxID=362523 RepID=A0ABS4BR52_9FLAO|nr:SO2930 family diheme c-type cytochrome [Mariniflexile gromovii]MBP0902575.1 hypothetical protein [Mariniflexile gromovii]